MNREGLKAFETPLPESVTWAKGGGDFAYAMACMDAQLEEGRLPKETRARLKAEKWLLENLPAEYPDPFDALLRKLREHVPGFTADELRELERRGKLDEICLGGEMRYAAHQTDTLLKVNPDFASRAGAPIAQRRPALDAAIAEMKERGEMRLRLSIRAHAALLSPKAGTNYRLYLPLPIPAAQQSETQMTCAQPAPVYVAPETAAQRTALFSLSRDCPEAELGYAYTQRVRYAQPFGPAPKAPLYDDAPPTQADLAEQGPHIVFTPLLRSLAREIVGAEKDPMCVVRLIYDYITTRVEYSFVRPYRLIENGAEYAALNGRGDCGIQALLLIALCRICGIPARWQSGLTVSGERVGNHDWAQFYAEPFGWLFADCSFGGSAYRAISLGADAEICRARHEFYFGNLDPYRMVANRAYFAPFDPPTRFLRRDPYDNQTGELETETRPCGEREWKLDYAMTGCEKR